jgi:hypothetical protein
MGLTGLMDQNYYFSAIKNAKRLHGSPSNGFLLMYSPHAIGYPIPWQSKQNKNQNALNNQSKNPALRLDQPLLLTLVTL